MATSLLMIITSIKTIVNNLVLLFLNTNIFLSLDFILYIHYLLRFKKNMAKI